MLGDAAGGCLGGLGWWDLLKRQTWWPSLTGHRWGDEAKLEAWPRCPATSTLHAAATGAGSPGP